VKDSIAAPKDRWLKTSFSNLVHYVPSGIYFARIRVRGKLIRRSLKTNTISVAKLRLADIEKIERQRIEIQGAVTSGNMRFGEALAIFRGRLLNNGSLKPRSKEFRKERIVAVLNSWPGLEQTEVRIGKMISTRTGKGWLVETVLALGSLGFWGGWCIGDPSYTAVDTQPNILRTSYWKPRRRCLRIRENRRWEAQKKQRNTPLPEKNRGWDWKIDLQTCGVGGKSRKRPALVVGKKSNGKCQITFFLVKRFAQRKMSTENEALESGLAEDQEFLRALLEHASDSIYFKDPASRFRRCSKYKLNRHGLTDREIIGKTDFDFYDERDARSAYNDEQEIMRTGQAITGKVEHQVMKDGVERWCLSSKWPLRNRKGETIGTFGISKDITALKQAEARLEQANKELVDASRLAGMAEVATTVLHNVGNVLNSVNVSASLLADKFRHSKAANLGKAAALLQAHAADLPGFLTDDPKGRQLPGYLASLAKCLAADESIIREELSSLCANIEHIKEIISTQQSYAMLAGVLQLFPAAELVEDALRLNAGALEHLHVSVIREFSPVPSILVDKHKVLQILVNLIRNATNALDDGGRPDKVMILRIAPGGVGTMKFSVIDNGVGIHPENLIRIFGHGFTTRKGGHGFGLHSGALAARQLGGSLTCQSDGPGKGATFTLELPLPPPSESQPAA
jgi:PAS domain S-box-containing protein